MPSFPPDDLLRIHSFVSTEPGPRLIVLGGVHGDETCGTVGIERLRAELDGGALRLARGELTLVPVANPLARRLLRREGERNLNRSFRPSEAPPDHEARLTNLLCPLLARHEVLLDLHSFQSAGEAFSMIGPRDNAGTLEPFARAFEEGQLALHIGTPRVVEGWLDIYAAGLAQRAGGQPADEAALAFGWGTNEYMRSQGGYGVTLECGQHTDPAAPEVAHAAIHSALRLLGMVDAPAPVAPPQPVLLRLVSVTDRAHEDDQFVREWATFDAVAQGEAIGVRADGSVLRAERDGFLVFPNTEALPGTEWFYFAVASERSL
ncbi:MULTISPECIES: succinylglutamate desuccinylase/aspartoacylase family protein [unclassified Variovorax]|uniref:succinylglutamate desuccinylase/aspartoacylase family protein n=1 Tax=unclassified Variovorax TaxID=663243 RepID=UPI002576A879|nr:MULTISPECIES: succinylglutamate desuccinylase/aspartoacylase family protein [unclassified Variovorax]MDM0089476.1 succinylglutamate desuccinylase/aspartoacylase family protein [Variovorax sp. J22G40]MDM0147548.1 succinylglutamate desuccinylase/aspartoacylase family protein [Variovorax sp. J2P1-31]